MKNRSALAEKRAVVKSQSLPFVSVVTPTWNRRTFLPYLLYMFQYQDYPADRRELVILDDSECSNADLVEGMKKYAACPELIRYYHLPKRLAIGAKRNQLNALAKGEYIICMDDDDYYPADKISYTIAEMQRHKARFAGCDSIPIWYSHIDRVYLSKNLGPRHALNGTFAYHRSHLKRHRYDDSAKLAEEGHFLKDFTTPVLQLAPERSILCISHNANTFDKDFVMGSSERDNRELTDYVTDAHLQRFYQRLRQAPVNTQIDWAFFDRVIVNACSADETLLAGYIDNLLAQGVRPEQLEIIPSQPDEPLASSHLLALEKARDAGWHNYLLLDDRTRFVRQEKTVKNLNQLLSACRALQWDVLLLGCELEKGQQLKTLPAALRATQASRPVAYAVHQDRYADFMAMLKSTRLQQLAAPDDLHCQQNLQWQALCEAGRWFALYPSYIYQDSDEAGQPLAHHFFNKLSTPPD
ncbi:glycosyltransferase family 2 protein [Erwinia sorbitola]|uniref:Glycosyltransferase n=1 Tax=Erwinia sorbitola TaxID=2681984 RepID=A0ABW9RDP2_9GAMM|nr:glycosyltransferase family 2 protein [Erwinia sorbitola]MTD26966.1 glycosyltransferase [Erwinia sorbitola]